MDLSFQQQFKNLYEKMFIAAQTGDQAEADRLRVLMEEFRLNQISNRNLIPENLRSLPNFVQQSLNKNQDQLGVQEPSNCIATAFNYHAETPTFSLLTPMDFLKHVGSEFVQIDMSQPLEIGDLVVLWSRNGDAWEDQKISLVNLRPELPGFPFGLVFDHVAVYVGDNKLFHKPDPTSASRYQVNEWDDVVGFNEILKGFELTCHRKVSLVPPIIDIP